MELFSLLLLLLELYQISILSNSSVLGPEMCYQVYFEGVQISFCCFIIN